jgi:hypothetical protein
MPGIGSEGGRRWGIEYGKEFDSFGGWYNADVIGPESVPLGLLKSVPRGG